MIRAVSLDFDNTLYSSNTNAGIKGLCSYMAAELGNTYGFWEREYQKVRTHVRETEWRHTQCYDIAYRIGILFNRFGLDPSKASEFAEGYYTAELAGSRFFPEVTGLIGQLKKDGYKVGTTTDSPLIACGSTLYTQKAGVELNDLDFVIASLGPSKRTGIPFRQLAEEMAKYGIRPEEIVHIGDSVESDIEPAL